MSIKIFVSASLMTHSSYRGSSSVTKVESTNTTFETKQSLQWKRYSFPRPKKAWQGCISVQSMIMFVFSSFLTSVVLCVETLSLPHLQDYSFNRELYCDVLKRLREGIRWHRPDLWSSNNWILRGDNVPCHKDYLTPTFLVENNMVSLSYLSYSSYLAPVDNHFIPQNERATQWSFSRFRTNCRSFSFCLQKMTNSENENFVISIVLRKMTIPKEMLKFR